MRLIPISFNGYKLNNENITSSRFIDPHAWSLSKSNVELVQRSGEFPVFGSAQFSEQTMSIDITLLREPNHNRNEMATYINTADKINRGLKQLIAFDTDGGRYVYVMAYPVTLICNDEYGKTWTATFTVPDPEWKTVKEFTVTKNLTASGQTQAVTITGNVPSEPKFAITPTTQKSAGYNYRRYVGIVSRFSNGTQANYPVDITDGGLDTATLVTAGKMQADGDDLRVLVNGAEVDRWLADMNDANTKVWINLSLPIAMRAMTLKTEILDSATDGIIISILPVTYKSGSTKKYTLANLPATGIFRIVTGATYEDFYYNAINPKLGQITVSARASRGTVAATHNVGDTIYYIPFDIQIVYGYASATAPTVDETLEPVLDLSTSTNTSWVYDEFGSAGITRPGAWTPSESNETMCEYYTKTDIDDETPFSVMGMVLHAYQYGSIWKPPTGTVTWSFYQPAGVTQFDITGKAKRYVASFPKISYLRKRNSTSQNWITQFASIITAAFPTANDTLESWTKAAEALGATYKYFQFILMGTIGSTANNEAALEVDGLTLTLDSNYTPLLTMTSEISQTYAMLLTITNTATYLGVTKTESLYINYPIQLNSTLIVDTYHRTVYINTSDVNALSAVTKDAQRLMWLPLYPGLNTLTFTEDGLAAVSVVISYREKYN